MFPYDGQSVCASASSDGSVRTSITSYNLFNVKKRARRHLEELVRVTAVRQSVTAARTDTGAVDSRVGIVELNIDKNGYVVDLYPTTQPYIPSSTVGIHALDVTQLQHSPTPTDNKHIAVFAYGGATGIVRIHTKNLKRSCAKESYVKF